MSSTTAGLMLWASSVGRGDRRPASERRVSGSITATVPGRLRPSGPRRRARARRTRRAARTRGARRGCRSRRPARRRASAGRSEPLGHLDAEAVVAEEDVADPGDEHARRAHCRASLATSAAARARRHGSRGSDPATRSASVAGSSSSVTATCTLAVDVVEDTGDDRDQAREEHVVRVGAARRAEAHARAGADLDSADDHGVGPTDRTSTSTAGPTTARRRRRAGSVDRGSIDRTRAVQALPHFGRHVVDAVDDRRRVRVGAARFGLLVVGQGQHAEGEDLVDLGGVEQIARRSRARPRGGRRG